MENTNPTGSESLDVNQAASAFEGMMGDSEEAEQGQSEGQPEDQQETDEVEYSDVPQSNDEEEIQEELKTDFNTEL